jgi:hypothetical protein
MRMSEVRAKAKALGIEPGKLKKTELICAIQRAEGFSPCFGSGKQDCPYTDCCFFSDCIDTNATGLLPA